MDSQLYFGVHELRGTTVIMKICDFPRLTLGRDSRSNLVFFFVNCVIGAILFASAFRQTTKWSSISQGHIS